MPNRLKPMILDFDRGDSLPSYSDESYLRQLSCWLPEFHRTKNPVRFQLMEQVRRGLAQRFTGPGKRDVDWHIVQNSGITGAIIKIALDRNSYDMDGGILEVRTG